jgi:phage-related protein
MQRQKASEQLETIKLTWKPVMAGILDIVGGAIGMVGGLLLVVLSSLFQVIRETLRMDPAVIQSIEQAISSLIALPVVYTFIGIVSIIGGVYALQRRIWPFALAGAISSCIAFPFFGIPSIIITALARDEFS